MRASSRRELNEKFSMRLFVCDPPGNQRHLDPALEPGRIERRIAAARMERGGIEDIRLLGIKADDVGRLADSIVSLPSAPASASANCSRVVSTSWGSWSEQMTSISPAARAPTSPKR